MTYRTMLTLFVFGFLNMLAGGLFFVLFPASILNVAPGLAMLVFGMLLTCLGLPVSAGIQRLPVTGEQIVTTTVTSREAPSPRMSPEVSGIGSA